MIEIVLQRLQQSMTANMTSWTVAIARVYERGKAKLQGRHEEKKSTPNASLPGRPRRPRTWEAVPYAPASALPEGKETSQVAGATQSSAVTQNQHPLLDAAEKEEEMWY